MRSHVSCAAYDTCDTIEIHGNKQVMPIAFLIFTWAYDTFAWYY